MSLTITGGPEEPYRAVDLRYWRSSFNEFMVTNTFQIRSSKIAMPHPELLSEDGEWVECGKVNPPRSNDFVRWEELPDEDTYLKEANAELKRRREEEKI